MTNRIPLIVNAGAAQIQEISSTDVLAVPGTLTANAVQTNNYQYANGQPFTGGGGGNANTGNIIFNSSTISTNAANADITIQGNGVGAINLVTSANSYTQLQNDSYANGSSYVYLEDGNVYISTNTGTWNFDTNGVLNVALAPSGPSNQIKYGMGNLVSWLDGGWVIGEYNDTNYGTEGIRINPAIEGPVDIYLPANQNANTNALTVSNYIGNVVVTSGDGVGNTYQWQFDNTGNLVLPDSAGISINYANGQPYGGSGSANIGNVTFDNQIIIGTGDSGGFGGLYLAPGNTEQLANSGYFRVRGGDVATHLHFDTGDNTYFDQYFGDDSKFVRLDAGDFGNITIGTYNPGESYRWTFDNTGNTTVPRDIQTVTTGFAFTSNISGVNTGSPTVLVTLIDPVFSAPETGQVTITGVVGTTEANNTWYFQSIDPSNFQLYYDSALENPVDGTGWTAYVSGGLAVSAGYNDLGITGGNVSITTNTGNTWTFDSTGNLYVPQGGYIGAAGVKGDGTMLTGGAGNIASLTSFYADTDFYSSCVTVNADGTLNITTYGNGTGQLGQWTFDGANLSVPGNTTIFTPIATGGAGGNNITIQAGSSDTFSVTPGGNLNLVGGYGSFGDGGGPPGGDVNITSGGSYDSHAGNVNIQTGSNNWTFDYTGDLTLPIVSLGESTDEQTVIQSQRKLIPPFRWSAEITGSTPTVVYTATNVYTTSMKVTIQIQHQSLGMEFFEVNATYSNPDTYYTMSNRLAPPTIDASDVVVNLNGSNTMEITVTINSGAATSWVTYDAVEFGIPQD